MDDLKKRKEKKKKGDEKKGKPEVDPVRMFADKIRVHKAMESRWAVIGEDRVEFFRGKDFVDVLKKHPDVINPQLKTMLEDETDPIEELVGDLLLARELIVRCDRVVKTVRPGRKKLSKFPGRLEYHAEQIFTEDDGFYAWRYEGKRTILQTIMSFLVPVVTILCCLFPVSPHWCKLSVLYLCLTLLGLIFGILFLRWAVFGIIWILVGKRVWFFPNILAEEATLVELVRVMPEKEKDEQPPPKLLSRLIVAVATAGAMWVCVTHAPDEQARAKYQERVSNIIDDVINFNPAMLVGKVANATAVPPPFAPPPSSSSNSADKASEEATEGKESATDAARRLAEEAEEALAAEGDVEGATAGETTSAAMTEDEGLASKKGQEEDGLGSESGGGGKSEEPFREDEDAGATKGA